MTARLVVIGVVSALAAFGQPPASVSRRADIRGGGGNGKCTIEVVVDGVAEVEIRGETAVLRTLQGQPASWRRFVCNQPMPPRPAEFRFRGIDGRGRQQLLRDPSREGVAVVRIEDSRSGSEGYTFDIEWRGSSGPGRGGGREGVGPGRDLVGGWRGARGSTFQFRGDGRGFFNRRDGRDMRVRDVNVSLTADGRVVLEFEAQGFQRLAFVGRATNYYRDYITAELAAGARGRDVRGEASIYLDRGGQVDRITMGGRIDGDPFRLTWNAR
jgi:hypothetical protein